MKALYALPLAGALLAGTATAQDEQAGARIGTLTCEATGITNAIIFTETEFACLYEGAEGFTEPYVGEIDKIGVDLSIKNDVTMVWAVLAPTDDHYEAGALEGTYVGASADAAVGVGAGAGLLVGGGGNSFTLQPVTVSGVEGVGASIGIESFELEPAA